MDLFGFGAKRKPVEKPAASGPVAETRPAASSGAPRRDRPNTPTARQRIDQQAGVEVSEFNLDANDFSSMFGTTASQFADAAFDHDDADPWSSSRHLD